MINACSFIEGCPSIFCQLLVNFAAVLLGIISFPLVQICHYERYKLETYPDPKLALVRVRCLVTFLSLLFAIWIHDPMLLFL